jgi:Mor family transcriptional regulator
MSFENLEDVKISLIDFIDEISEDVGAVDWEFCDHTFVEIFRSYGLKFETIYAKFYFEEKQKSIIVAVAVVEYVFDRNLNRWIINEVKKRDKEEIRKAISKYLNNF